MPIIWLVLITFLFNTVVTEPVFADVPFLPPPGRMVPLTPSFSPSVILGLKVFKNNPFKFEFVMSQGDRAESEDPLARRAFLKAEGDRLVKYFLASLTIPEKDMWVNLSPYEHGRVIQPEFGLTEMGKEMLAQDYLLKQVTASVMYPEGNIGREFWSKIYEEAYKRLGTTNIPVSTFNKVWILPDQAVVYEDPVDNTAVIIKAKLKVMLEEDYLALHKTSVPHENRGAAGAARQLSNALIRRIILPLIDKEVNTGKNFAALRQVYNSLILAFWYKNKLKESLIGKGYVNRKKIHGVEVTDKNIDEEIYRQYIKSYKKGVYNYIKEDVNPWTGETVPRKYFSGGIVWDHLDRAMSVGSGRNLAQAALNVLNSTRAFELTVGLEEIRNGGSDLDLAQITSPKPMMSASEALRLGTSISETKDFLGPQQFSDAAMLGTTFRKFALAAVTLAFLAGANVAYAKGAQNLAPPGPQQTIQQVVAGPTAINDFQKLNRTVQDLQSTFDDDTQGNRIFGALANPVVPRFTAEANALHDLLKDPGFIKSLPEGQRADIVHTLNQLEQSTRTIVKTWGAASTIHSQSLQNLNQSLGDIHRLLESLNQQTQSNAGAVFTAGVPPSVPATAGAPPPPPLLPTVGVPSPAPSAVGVAPQVPAAGINQNLNPHSSPPSSVSQPAVVSSQTAPVQGYAFTNEMNRESQVQASNTAEENNLNSQIAQSKLKAAQAEEAARVKQAEERQLVATYHLSVPQLPPVPLPYQTPGIAPPINGFSPDNVGVAWIDYQINQINHEARMPAKGNLANGTPFTLEMNNAPQVSQVVPLGKGNYFSIVPDLPFREELNLTQISQGLTQIGTQSTLSQVAGPLYGAQILADLRNYVVMHPTRGQDVLYDARMGPLGGIVQSLTVHVTPVISFDQQGHRVEEKLYNVGIVQTVGAVLGKLDYILGNRGIIGHSSDHFVFENLGYQLKVNDYHRAFTYDASFNRDPNAIYIDVYKIDDPHTRYRQNNHHGWEKVDSSVPFDSRLDMYRATVRGFILHVDPSKGTIQGQGDVYTAETFVTDDFARRLTEQETGKAVTGKPYLEPNAVFMERMPSLQDLQLEKQLLKGFDAQGHMIWGVLRNPLSGHIVRFITDPRQLNETSALTDNHGQRLRFVPGKAFQVPSGLQEAGGVIRDYTSDEFSRVFDE
ncbi:MAG: hypothetical protein KGI24_08690, partial [Candidatus Omnitrophica bacterium]|nr:hypothetical protein [Candidatus Omnitrophota bacterium]